VDIASRAVAILSAVWNLTAGDVSRPDSLARGSVRTLPERGGAGAMTEDGPASTVAASDGLALN
jgi:hypothetical protein